MWLGQHDTHHQTSKIHSSATDESKQTQESILFLNTNMGTTRELTEEDVTLATLCDI